MSVPRLPTLFFPSDPLSRRRVEPMFEGEVDAAARAGFRSLLIDSTALDRRDREGLIRDVGEADEQALYRGWMMSDLAWADVHDALVHHGFTPLVTPEAYAQAHYLPRAYPSIAEHTARSVWIDGFDLDRAWDAARSLGPVARIVKDHVKSAKHRWNDACFLPADVSRARFDEVVLALIDDRGPLLEKGLVFREILPLRELGTSMLGAPIHDEIRLFFWRGEPLALASLARIEGSTSESTIPGSTSQRSALEPFREMARRFESPFLTMDVARTVDDTWLVIEVGDGGVSGIPPVVSDDEVYAALARAILGR